MRFRRSFFLIFCLCMLAIPVSAQKTRYVALTFDDGPSGRFTEALLNGLQERNVNATFFLCGYRMQDYPALTERIYAEGHEIGLHGFSHKAMNAMTSAELRQELRRCRTLLPEGCSPAFLRPPGGCCSTRVCEVAEREDLAVLQWSVDPRDWALHDSDTVVQSILSHTGNGDVILMHDMSNSSVSAALAVIDRLQAEGYVFVTASQLAKLEEIEIRSGCVYHNFYGQSED